MRSLLLLLTLAAAAAAQPPMPIDTSYLKDHAQTRGFMLGRPVRPRLTPDGKAVLFLRSQPRQAKMSLFELDLASGKARELITPEALLKGAEEKLTPEEKARRERQRVTVGGFTTYHLSRDGKFILLSLSGRPYVVERGTGKVTEVPAGKGTIVDLKFAPDGGSIFYVRDHDVYRVDLKALKEVPVTRGGTEKKPHGLAEFVAQEEMGRHTGFWVSPDAKHVAYQESDHDGVEVWSVADPIHPERPGHPSYYPRPGKANVRVRLGVVPVAGGETVWVEWDREKYPYLARVDWKKGGLTLLVQNRLQQEQVLLRADPTTGKTAPLLVEKDPAWLNLSHDGPHWLDDGSFLWHGHGKGGAELQHREATGALVRVLAPAMAGFRGIVHVDAKRREVVYTASDDPTQQHVFRKSLIGGRPVPLTREPGLHTAEVGRSGAYVVTSSLLEALPQSIVYSPEGKKLADLPSVAEQPPFVVKQSIQKVGKGPGFWTTVIRPRKFDAKKRYPVIVHVYGGPGHLEVLSAMQRRLIDQWIADQGFLVVGIDNRGTPNRGRDWERATYRKFGTMALDDQVAGLQALGEKFPEMDLDRVGIYGWSYGGYMSAQAVLRRPKVFKAAIAGAPVTEWLDYDTHYTERFMGVPGKDDPDYRRESLLTYAKDLGAPLLLVHGTADDNVYFRHTLRLADALFREGKEFEVLPLSGLTHLVPDPVVTQRLYGRFVGFFRKHLGTPRGAK